VTAHPLLPPAAEVVAEMHRSALDARQTGAPSWATLIVDLVESNLRQWDLEDTTRDPAASDAEVAGAKREIDRLNMGRHRLIQAIDSAIDSVIDQPPHAPLATESPGMVLDRLSVLVIRRVRTVAAARRDPVIADRVLALDAQIDALSLALNSYMDELRAGHRRFIRYESFKLYGSAASPAGSVKE
jgi:hypothetical protein